MHAAWGYGPNDGPDTWAKHFPAACGSRQSPINIDTYKAQYDKALSETPLKMSYQPEEALHFANNGHSMQADCTQASTLTGGPLGNKVYRLAQFHLHWGAQDDRGAEHTIDGKVYPAELHLVHWNSTVYKNVTEAVSKSDGLAVLCVFIKVGSPHEGFEAISSQLTRATCKGDSCKLSASFDPTCLLPGDTKRFWTYPGSLTTPPCHESVQFILFEKTVEFSPEQMAALRSLHFGGKDSGCMGDNFRPPCKVGDRTILASFAY